MLFSSPHLTYSQHQELNHTTQFLRVFDTIVSKQYNQEFFMTMTGKGLQNYRMLVIGEFYRKNIDTNFPYNKPNKNFKLITQLEVELWSSVINMLGKMHIDNYFSTEPAILFYRLIDEQELMELVATYSEGDITVKNYLAHVQSQNRKLQGCENPFDSKETPDTRKIIEQAITLANRSDDFRRYFYMPVVRSRQTCIARMKEYKIRVYFQGKLQRQGRKKQLVTRTFTQ